MPDLQDFQTGNHTFERMTIYDVWRKNVSGILGGSAPEQMRVGLVSGEFFRVLGIQPVLGRLLRPPKRSWGVIMWQLSVLLFGRIALPADPMSWGKRFSSTMSPTRLWR